MNLLEVREGLTINLDSVDAVEKKGKFSSVLTIGGKEFIADHPYETIVSMLHKSHSQGVFQRP